MIEPRLEDLRITMAALMAMRYKDKLSTVMKELNFIATETENYLISQGIKFEPNEILTGICSGLPYLNNLYK